MKRGDHKWRFDKTNDILLVRWSDNSDLLSTMIKLSRSNLLDNMIKRKKSIVSLKQQLIHFYNQNMDSVDL